MIPQVNADRTIGLYARSILCTSRLLFWFSLYRSKMVNADGHLCLPSLHPHVRQFIRRNLLPGACTLPATYPCILYHSSCSFADLLLPTDSRKSRAAQAGARRSLYYFTANAKQVRGRRHSAKQDYVATNRSGESQTMQYGKPSTDKLARRCVWIFDSEPRKPSRAFPVPSKLLREHGLVGYRRRQY